MKGNNRKHFKKIIENLLRDAKYHVNERNLESAIDSLGRAQTIINSFGFNREAWEEEIFEIEKTIHDKNLEMYIEDFKKAAELGEPYIMESILRKIVESPVKYNIKLLEEDMKVGYEKRIKTANERVEYWGGKGFTDLKSRLKEEVRSYQEKLEILNKEGIEGILKILNIY